MSLLKDIEYKGKCWPTRDQELLLKASLFSGEKALNSWNKWTNLVDFNTIDQASYRLLPLAVHNLEKEGINDSFLKKFRGLKKKTWFKNQILFKTLKDVLISFHAHNIKTMVLKGAALIPLYFEDMSIRPLNDVDILIPQESVLLASKILISSGWRIKVSPKKGIKKEFLNVRDSICFKNNTVSSVDLHWHAVKECIYPGADHNFWEHARSINIDGVDTHVMSPTDQLYLTCVHALRHQAQWEPLSLITWITDCLYILRRSHNEIDFNRMLDQAQMHNLVLSLRISLNYLNQKYKAALPTEFIYQLRKSEISTIEYNEFMIRQNCSYFTGPFRLRWCAYLRSIQEEKPLSFFSKIWGFIKYLKAQHRLPSVLLLPVSILSKRIKKLRIVPNELF